MPKIMVTEDQWIRLGMERFSQGGAEALVIEKMALALKCSKSSFYWYFSDRKTFVRRIVDEWIDRSTKQVMEAASSPASAEEKLAELLRQMFAATRKGDFLFYLRRLSAKEPAYRKVLEAMEHARMKFAAGLFAKLGMSAEDATSKAWILYHYYLGWYERHKLDRIAEEDVLRHVNSIRKRLIER
ncbi:TetR/AcrR family transcriptional regulator [Cohnella massiliensis]|uniref:TetR/AcrR family transcriptional regulator n=1 Tax=Cohnella massiliensis TaxID=1816691 RepID=UPI0009BC1A9B|nr:TetR/AcrR family transcriptional regulator [Cohnella massiliensis]